MSGDIQRVWKGTYPLEPGDMMRIVAGGGGGYGPAWDREPARVLADIAAGYVTPGHAADAYGVVLDPDGGFDVAATEARRADLRAAADHKTREGDEA